jgi:cell division protease FtsH
MHINDKDKVTFGDVAGADIEKGELEEIVEFLKDPQKFTALGAKIPRGVLLVGPPGTGKTLLAKAVAGEANVPFFSISGSDFVEMFVGVGASRVRDLFEQAKKNSPSIIFIDEIDAVGRQRGAGLGGGHDEREQTLNQLLVEMDGFSANQGVIVIAATNRPDILDNALLRPGRFDRQVVVDTPDLLGRLDILKVHARNKPLAKEVDLSVIAKSTSGFTGADLANLLNEAALLAARKDQKEITNENLEDAMIKVIVGTEKKNRKKNEKENKLTAYHEAGHAVVTKLLPSQDPVHQVSIIPRGRAGGYTMHLPQEDKSYILKGDMIDEIVVLLGGRVAEKLVLDDISTGASNDIERASKIARQMVTHFGMSDKIGPIHYGSDNDEVFIGRDFVHSKNFSEKISAEIDDEVRKIMNECYEKCIELIKANMDKLENVAKALLEREKISGEEFEIVYNGGELPPVLNVQEQTEATDSSEDKQNE